jgi:hypothetical protein
MTTTTPNQTVFYGYSDDLVMHGTSKTSLDEYYSEHYLLSDGTRVSAIYGDNGWTFTCSHPESVIVPACDPDDEGIDYDDERVPHWCDADGYTPILIIPDALEIIAHGDSPFTEDGAKRIHEYRLLNSMRKHLDLDMDWEPELDQVAAAMEEAGYRYTGSIAATDDTAQLKLRLEGDQL